MISGGNRCLASLIFVMRLANGLPKVPQAGGCVTMPSFLASPFHRSIADRLSHWPPATRRPSVETIALPRFAFGSPTDQLRARSAFASARKGTPHAPDPVAHGAACRSPRPGARGIVTPGMSSFGGDPLAPQSAQEGPASHDALSWAKGWASFWLFEELEAHLSGRRVDDRPGPYRGRRARV